MNSLVIKPHRWHWGTFLALAVCCIVCFSVSGQETRWSEERANLWYQQQPWLIGSNFLPSDAVNEIEMWQADTFDPKEIDREFGWAESLGMNTMRVFLHNLPWEQDPDGFQSRIDQFLAIAARHHIRPVLVLFDSCWDPNPKLGPQPQPVPGVHNSRWVQAPGKAALIDPQQYPRLKEYVQAVVGSFANDTRILAWDVWNEPDNTNGSSYGKLEPANKQALVLALLPQAFDWARSVHPVQPLTSGVWTGDWSSLDRMSPTARVQIEESDIITFHHYEWPERFEARIHELEQFNRPILCTEFMARGAGNIIDVILPIAQKYHIGVINWGLVKGRSQTYLPWDSWQHPYVKEEPRIWFHDLFHEDGTPYRAREAEIIRNATGKEPNDGAGPK